MTDRQDRIQQEIEEILAKLDVGDEGDTITKERPIEHEPISIEQRRRSARAARPGVLSRLRDSIALPDVPVSPAGLLFFGAGTMVAGLILATFWSPLIWLSFAGVLAFILAFVWSFARRRSPGGISGGYRAPRQKYWRGRYIDIEPGEPSTGERLKRMFRRR